MRKFHTEISQLKIKVNPRSWLILTFFFLDFFILYILAAIFHVSYLISIPSPGCEYKLLLISIILVRKSWPPWGIILHQLFSKLSNVLLILKKKTSLENIKHLVFFGVIWSFPSRYKMSKSQSFLPVSNSAQCSILS